MWHVCGIHVTVLQSQGSGRFGVAGEDFKVSSSSCGTRSPELRRRTDYAAARKLATGYRKVFIDG